MNNFSYRNTTQIHFGQGQIAKIRDEMPANARVLITYGGGSIKKNGVMEQVHAALEGVTYFEFGGIEPNPHFETLMKAVDVIKQENINFILAVGGGSVIDSAKAIGYGVANPWTDVWNFFLKTEIPNACLPIGAIPTIAASGSEMSGSCVITNEDGWLKRGSTRSDLCRPKFTLMNPRLTYTLPEYQTESGCVDILLHTMERYFVNIETMEITDSISESLMQTVIYNARILLNEPGNYNARAEIMWAGSLSHNGLTGCGTGGGDWACHQLEHELGGLYDVTHGAGLAALWGSWARYVYDANPERFAQFATNIFDIPCFADYENTALAGIEAMEDFFRSIHMPTNLHELGLDLTDEQIHELAFKCSFEDTRTIGVFKQLNMKDMEKIYAMAR